MLCKSYSLKTTRPPLSWITNEIEVLISILFIWERNRRLELSLKSVQKLPKTHVMCVCVCTCVYVCMCVCVWECVFKEGRMRHGHKAFQLHGSMEMTFCSSPHCTDSCSHIQYGAALPKLCSELLHWMFCKHPFLSLSIPWLTALKLVKSVSMLASLVSYYLCMLF